MISDVLSESMDQIEVQIAYYPEIYNELKGAIDKVTLLMNAMRAYLDSIPGKCEGVVNGDAEELLRQISSVDVRGVSEALDDLESHF